MLYGKDYKMPGFTARTTSNPPRPGRTLTVACLLAVLLVPGDAGTQDALKALDLLVPDTVQASRAFSVPTPDGKAVTLSGYRGKVVLLNFWATWCVPGRE